MAEAVVTKLARTKMMKARAGAISLPKIVGMAFGAGGVDSSGNALTPSETQTALKSELLRKKIDKYEILSDTKCRYVCTLLSNELVGKNISELALYDEAGDLVAIKNFMAKGKDADIEITFHMDDEF